MAIAGFLGAHGYDPGPTQRPTLAGCVTGVFATVPATAFLIVFGALKVEASILGLSVAATLVLGWIVMGLAGSVYGRIFRRAANDRRGGWLFGMAFGFLLWAGGAVMVLPVASGGYAPAGRAAIGLFLSLIAWGAALGFLFPHVHRRIARRGERWTISPPTEVGPSSVAFTGGLSRILEPRNSGRRHSR